MPRKRSKAEVGTKAAPRLPRLPDELWDKIFHDVAQHYDSDLATLRLVNKRCATLQASRQHARIVRRMFRRKRQWHVEELHRKTQAIRHDLAFGIAQQERAQLEARYAGEVAGEQRMEQFLWKVADKSVQQRALIPFLKSCIDTLRELGY